MKEADRSEDLDHAVDLYWKAVHWQDALAGSALVAPDARSDWLKTRDKQERNLNVTSYEIQGEKIDRGGDAATVLVKMTWYLLPSLTEQNDLVQQRWVLISGHWLVGSEKGGPLPFP